ncbi:MAG: peptidylprolyl isomerase [bacterium]|nr:peptidylprolyl isomerase [bacterium]
MKNLFTQLSAITFTFLLALTACNNSAKETTEQSAEVAETPNITATTEAPQPVISTADKIYIIKTSAGDIKVRLYKECPLHQANFAKLVDEKFYDGILFHRIIKGFMIQTGDPDSKKAEPGKQYGVGGPGYTIPAEILPNFYHKKGALAAARQGDQVNPYKESSGSQFYIVQGTVMPKEQLVQFGKPFTELAMKDYATLGGTPQLDGDYTVFGETIAGIEVIDAIANTLTDSGDRPKKDIKIISITEETK